VSKDSGELLGMVWQVLVSALAGPAFGNTAVL
jgi:hypothetical protein